MKKFKTPQEKFWAGNFGNKYLKRKNKSLNLQSNQNLFNLALKKTKKINSCIELGAGAGKNLICLKPEKYSPSTVGPHAFEFSSRIKLFFRHFLIFLICRFTFKNRFIRYGCVLIF